MRRWWKRDTRDELIDELRDRIRSLERRLDEGEDYRRRTDTIIAQLTQANAALNDRLRELEVSAAQAPPASGGAVEEARKEVARRLVGGVFGLAIFIPSSITSVISYFNGASAATILAAASAVFGLLLLVGTYFGIKASAEASAETQRIAAEANITAERAAREAQQELRDDG
jgi:cell division septum initiation protein DivIVA